MTCRCVNGHKGDAGPHNSEGKRYQITKFVAGENAGDETTEVVFETDDYEAADQRWASSAKKDSPYASDVGDAGEFIDTRPEVKPKVLDSYA